MRHPVWTVLVPAAFTLVYGCGGRDRPALDEAAESCLEAAGGEETLRGLSVIHTMDSLSIAGMTGTTESWWVREPFMGLSVTEIGPIRHEVLIRGDSVWTVDRNGHLSPGGLEERDQMELSRATVFYGHLLEPSMLTVGPDTVLYGEVTVPFMLRDHPNVVLHYSRDNWLPVMMRTVTMGMEVRSYPGRYVEIDGIATPTYSLSTIPSLGQEMESWNLLTEYNVPVPESVFVLTAGAADWDLPDPGLPRPFFLKGEHIFLHGEVNGVPVLILLDSGAGATVLDSALALNLGLEGKGRLPARGIGGTREFSFAEVEQYTAAGAGVSNQTLAVLPVSAEFYPSTGEMIDLIIGYDFLSRFITEIDYGEETITLWCHGSHPGPPEGSSIIRAERSMSLLTVEAVLEDSVPVRLVLDTGAGGNIHLTQSFFEKHPGFLADRPSFETEIRGVGGSETIQGFRVSTVTLGDFTVPGGLCTSFPGGETFGGHDGILGNGILSRFIVTLDYRSGLAALRPSALFDRGLPETLTGMGLEIRDGELAVRTVISDSPAERAGLRMGDIVRGVDGNQVSAEHLGSIATLFPGTEGESSVMLIERDGSEIEVELVTGRLVP